MNSILASSWPKPINLYKWPVDSFICDYKNRAWNIIKNNFYWLNNFFKLIPDTNKTKVLGNWSNKNRTNTNFLKVLHSLIYNLDMWNYDNIKKTLVEVKSGDELEMRIDWLYKDWVAIFETPENWWKLAPSIN